MRCLLAALIASWPWFSRTGLRSCRGAEVAGQRGEPYRWTCAAPGGGALGLELRRLPGQASAGAQGCWLREAERGWAGAWGEAGPGGLGWSTPLWAQLCPRWGGELREAASSSAFLLPSGHLLQPDPRDQSSPSRVAGLLKHRYPTSAVPCYEPHAHLNPLAGSWPPAPVPASPHSSPKPAPRSHPHGFCSQASLLSKGAYHHSLPA